VLGESLTTQRRFAEAELNLLEAYETQKLACCLSSTISPKPAAALRHSTALRAIRVSPGNIE
jgi:hypothetical protein